MMAAQLALILTACSDPEEKRSFTVPSELCGTPVPTASLDAVLPRSGSTVKADAQSREVGRTHCKVSVDGKTVLSAFSEWKRDASIATVAGSNPYIELDGQRSEDGTYAWSSKGGVRLISCPAAAKEHPDMNQLFVRVLIYDKKFSDIHAAKNLLLAYARSVADSAACRGTAS
ncbi:hypothetical protein SSP531S_58520 [Streptomyces spongiicola]|uniref:DUF3558 domain-containing protein n=1 Tax=Streptomyces spongiicola TaxID=1690221 RepID=A0A388T5Y2_9ACTN|nr:hypothetical protein [Streptomyces spongiicola]GBQ04358.1 hypothetical protein SSP531S_58520 [Streptomyces spongiicola]